MFFLLSAFDDELRKFDLIQDYSLVNPMLYPTPFKVLLLLLLLLSGLSFVVMSDVRTGSPC